MVHSLLQLVVEIASVSCFRPYPSFCFSD